LSAHPELVEGSFVGVYLAQEIIHLRMAFWVYILRCADGSYYVGHTDDIELRLAKYQAGEFAGYTRTRLPVELTFIEEFASRSDAFVRERQIKGWSRKKKEGLIRGDWTELSRACASFDRSRSLTAGFLGRPLVPSPSRNQDERKNKFFWKTNRSCDEDHPKGHCHFGF
jgi:putative endonuclease